ncbi:N-acetylglucosamine transport system substrate-binding protein [Arthrobacter pigmenti]|uniref:N-acetylglucosamine transport system substrate-binding protein n=1 Tax=Arthrobacter pigmenti TaxID=271432 RepID=A0A846RUC0_9MICC|nr:N-acetylglucosamine/diacetylchitobiose ABC transporter substrate-binding protein [Arthrobacter pigmenti]NJC21861.1 N-acetylglucosamine transport system substrate-binding protein [Arthrobacter pigmenti]
MNFPKKPVERRNFLKGALATAALIPLGGALASCAAGGGAPNGGNAPEGEVSDTNPFGVAADSTVDVVIFNGGYGIDYAEFAGELMAENQGVTVNVAPSTNLAQELQPRFVGGNPPDVIDNSGANAIGIATILAQLEDLTDVIDAQNIEGETIRDTLFPGVLQPGTFDGKLAAINYVLTVYALWYSQSLFDENGWTVPTTWDEMMALGEQAKAQDKYLFCWGQEAASYYLELAIASGIKEGGHEVRLALENLEADCWSKPALQEVFTALEEIIAAGYVLPGGSGTQFTAAQAQWIGEGQEALLYPSGSWIENEMRDQMAENFQLTGAPVPTVSSSPALPYEALHSAAGEPFIVPSQGANVAGGKEYMRTMLSKEAATNFTESKLSPTIVRGTVPEDGFGSTALVSQVELLEAAGENVFTWSFIDFYGMNQDHLVWMNSFLDGEIDAAGLTTELQAITDAIRNDDSIEKLEVQ